VGAALNPDPGLTSSEAIMPPTRGGSPQDEIPSPLEWSPQRAARIGKAKPPSTQQAQREALRLFHNGRTALEIAEALRIPESLAQVWIAGATA
jgi:hypothetical protein